RVWQRPQRPAGADRPRRLVVAAAAGAGEARGGRPAHTRAAAPLSARRMALQDGAQGLVRRHVARTAHSGLAATAVEQGRADRDLRLVPRQPRAGRQRRRHPPRPLESAGARPAQAPVVIVLSQQEVEELLDLDALIDALADAHRELSEGKASMPPRIAAFAERNGLLGAMPAYLPSAGLACKLVSLFPENRDRHTHQALIAVFDETNGTPIALMDGTHITATRTAAGSALATRLLAREDARVLAILGAGVQARTHADALRRVRQFDEVRVASRDPERAEAVAAEIGASAASSFEDAVRGADVVAATTHATEPVVLREWLAPRGRVNPRGAEPARRGGGGPPGGPGAARVGCQGPATTHP